MAAVLLRSRRSNDSSAPTISLPSSRMLPVIVLRLGLCRPRTAIDETDLPEPDSPTIARVRPSRAS
ncbi:MAG: hypothetical protein BWY91_02516 [bacterium ADurb.BinA028]|nr:MAG: hypothetical protein BWY91_02516 [bacterium ADurb.BinA028]